MTAIGVYIGWSRRSIKVVNLKKTIMTHPGKMRKINPQPGKIESVGTKS